MPRPILDESRIHPTIREGSYFRGWRRRTALKMRTGWQTFPMIFVKGALIGGASDLAKLIESGELKRMLVDPGSRT